MSRTNKSRFRITFLFFPILSLLCTWPHHGAIFVGKVVSNVESSLYGDIAAVETAERYAVVEEYAFRKSRAAPGKSRM